MAGEGVGLPELVSAAVSDAGREAGPPLTPREPRRACPAATREGMIGIVLPGDLSMTGRGRMEERTLRAVLAALRPA